MILMQAFCSFCSDFYMENTAASLLSNFEKILERLTYNRMYKFFSDNNLNYPLQFDFRQKYLTVYAFISLAESIGKIST